MLCVVDGEKGEEEKYMRLREIKGTGHATSFCRVAYSIVPFLLFVSICTCT